MIGLLKALARARAVRPLWWWVLALLIYVVLPLPSSWVLLLVVGLGIALAVTVARLRERGRQARHRAAGAWELVERLAGAVEDRIRGPHKPPVAGQVHGYPPPGPAAHSGLNGAGPVYDPGALLAAIAAVLAAEGIPTDTTPALPAVVRLLANQGITARPGAPASTAHGLVSLLRPGVPRRHRVMPPSLLAEVIRAVLTQDRTLPQHITIDSVKDLTTDTALILRALHIRPDNQAAPLHQWPIIARILDAASPCQPSRKYGEWGQ